ncbi:hypothetical protein R69749_00900 [Paraburkholderia domus]|nr:hypothetical protein R70006_02285 [Paraburkholderia domus]CAE6763470.1 hypothetical protein R69749_00900 [Paraburkholderia domus]
MAVGSFTELSVFVAILHETSGRDEADAKGSRIVAYRGVLAALVREAWREKGGAQAHYGTLRRLPAAGP